MNKNNAIIVSNNIKKEFSEYIKSTFDINEPTYRNLFHQRIDDLEKSLYQGPYLSVSESFVQDKTINQLCDEGILHKDFKKLGGLDLDRPLYKHQVEAIKRIEGVGGFKPRSVVITTGTGSGKTNCFLYPIIDSIIKEIYESKNGGKPFKKGIRAIFLYPMNALINDQVDSIRTLLKEFPEITYGFYTGEVLEDDEGNDLINNLKWYTNPITKQIEKVPNNEITTRTKLREEKPSILFTNYSMLEYMLIRPVDRELFSKDALSNWRYVVMDEAHTYKGASGIENAILMRRLCGFSNRHPQFILTSATLGSGKEDINKIIEFATKLTNSNYVEDDVIFSDRISIENYKELYSIDPLDYETINKTNSYDEVLPFLKKYNVIYSGNDYYEAMFELVSQDKNAHALFKIINGSNSFSNVLLRLQRINPHFNEEILCEFIDLISKIKSKKKYGVKLFDIKYHFFVKAPDGAYVTIGDQKDLKLTACSTINGNKAFKMGICQSCKTPYIFGKTISLNNKSYLMIDDEIDMDESYSRAYGDKYGELEYYLIKDTLNQQEASQLIKTDPKDNNLFAVCSKCGHIRNKSLNPPKMCEHGTQYEVDLIRCKNSNSNKKDDNYNCSNIDKCPVCDYDGGGHGVVLGFHIGKDRATALLSQILYHHMPTKMIEGHEAKQFIAFSDSRQQAAFFNKFIDETNKRFMRKGAIWSLIKDGKTKKVKELISDLEDLYSSHGFVNSQEQTKEAWLSVLWDLLLIDGRNSSEGLGLYYFLLDLPDNYYENQKQNIIDEFAKLGITITYDQYISLVRQCFEIFRTVPAIDYTMSYIAKDKEEAEDLLGYRSFDNYISLKLGLRHQDTNARSFLPVIDGQLNKTVDYVMRCFGCSDDVAIKIMNNVWERACGTEYEKRLLQPALNKKTNCVYKIPAIQYKIYPYHKLSVFRCDKCRSLTINNINNVCPTNKCNGNLVKINPEIDPILKNSYYRKEYINRSNKIERIISEEHTAQIGKDRAKKYQDDFKSGRINILSSSTTFELGISLGDLTTVFMRNVPPTPSNYIQRAGRAGRSADTPAYVLTFCGLSSHDFTYFKEPLSMISGSVLPPSFDLRNEIIVIRHLAAASLGFYFNKTYQDGNDQLNVGNFLESGVDGFVNYLKEKPADLIKYINESVLTDLLKDMYPNDAWINKLISDDADTKGSLVKMVDGLKDDLEAYRFSVENPINKDSKQYYENLINQILESNSLISYLARYGVIPRYGFPVDNADLILKDKYNYKKISKYNLNRDLSIAISEYAPGSEVIVDKRKFTSRYIKIPMEVKKELLKEFFYECSYCHGINIYPTENAAKNQKCKYCSSPLHNIQTLLHPIAFVSDFESKRTNRLKPARTYAGDIRYIGNASNPLKENSISNGAIVLTEYRNEKLLVLNESSFYYCKVCGYTVVGEKNDTGNTKTIKVPHKNIRPSDCSNTKPLERIRLGHSYFTDVVKLSFNGIKTMKNYDYAISTLYALLGGISKALSIERDDIGGIVEHNLKKNSYDLIVFDTVSGGAGHTKRINDIVEFKHILDEAKKIVDECDCDKDTSCYGCLRNFSNQRYHSKLKRSYASEAIGEMLSFFNKKIISYEISQPDNLITSMSTFKSCISWYNGIDKQILEEIYYKISLMAKQCWPNGNSFDFKSEISSKKYNVDFYWAAKKVVLLSKMNNETFDELNANSDFKCFIIHDKFDVDNFINELNK